MQPIGTLDGRHSMLNTVTIDNVRVPTDQRVGNEGQGWRYAKGECAGPQALPYSLDEGGLREEISSCLIGGSANTAAHWVAHLRMQWHLLTQC